MSKKIAENTGKIDKIVKIIWGKFGRNLKKISGNCEENCKIWGQFK